MTTSADPTARTAHLNGLLPFLRTKIRGQDHALPRIASLLHRGELGLTKGARPRGSFLLLGPTGVGKTQVTIEFTGFLFGPDHLFRFDMSEFQNQESLGILIGGRLGERGTLALVTDKTSSGTLLFDEVEKAHPRVLDVFLQILDAGRVTLANGETLDLSGFYTVLTSNLGSAELMTLQHSSFTTMERHVLTRAQQSLRPELYARINEKLVFNRLSYEMQLEIAQMLLDEEVGFLRGRSCELKPAPGVLPFLVRQGFHSRLGARPMRDAVEKFVGDAVTTDLLGGGRACGELTVNETEQSLVVRRS